MRSEKKSQTEGNVRKTTLHRIKFPTRLIPLPTSRIVEEIIGSKTRRKNKSLSKDRQRCDREYSCILYRVLSARHKCARVADWFTTCGYPTLWNRLRQKFPPRSIFVSFASFLDTSIINFKVERSSPQFVDPPLEPDLSPLEGGRIESTYVGTWPILSSWFFFFFFFSHRRQNDRAGIIIDDRFEKGVSVLSGLRRRFRVVEILYGTWETGRSRQNEQKPC